MKVSPFVHRLCLAVAASVLLISAGCSSDSSPTSPTPTTSAPPATQPGPAPTAPNATGAVTIAINPNPVPHSGAAITDAAGCVGVRFTWFYDQVLQETGGSTVTFTNRIDLFDDRETNNVSVNIVVPANGSTTVRSRWCSSNRAAHSSQTRWTGTDASGRAISVLGPRVILNAPQ
jgi:hypothetical protein